MTLTEFLLARIAEDEAWASARQTPGDWAAEHLPGWVATRVLADCEAKRQIVEQCQVPIEQAERTKTGEPSYYMALTILDSLALPYADHPDYDEAWRP